MLNDPKVMKLFELLLEKKVTTLDPVFAPRRDAWVSYPSAESALGSDSEYTLQLLEDLHRMGYLDKRFSDKVLLCPACNSQDLKFTGVCPSCSSAHVLRQRVLEHKNCGYRGSEDDFSRAGARVCPKCRMELALAGSDYAMLGPLYQCRDCGHTAEAPVDRWHCRACGQTFGRHDLRELLLYSYALNQAQLSRLRVERIPKARVNEFLAKDGYEVQEAAQVTGRSGAEHSIDLLASKRAGSEQHRVVVGFASAEEAVEPEEVIKLYAKAYDVGAQETVLVVSPRLSDDAEQLARHYNIKVYRGDELDRLSRLEVGA